MGGKLVIESASLTDSRVRRTVVEISNDEEAFAEGVRNILRELPEGDDLIILTLKGHLIIEQLLIQMMAVTASNPKALADLNRLPFSARLAITRSLVRPTEWFDQKLWPLVKKVGKIRNDIAHQLKPKKLDKQIETFIQMFIRTFGARVKPPVTKAMRTRVTKDNVLIPQELRRGDTPNKYRYCLAGTAQALAGILFVLRDDATIAKAAIEKKRAADHAPPKKRAAQKKRK